MHHRTSRLRRVVRCAIPLVLAALAALSAPVDALAREVPTVVPGRKLFGEVQPASTFTVVLEGVEGMALTLQAKSFRGSLLLPALSLKDPLGNAVDLLPFSKESKSGNKVSVKKLILELTGQYELTIEGVFGTTGGFDLITKGKAPKKYAGSALIDTADTDISIPFAGLPGDVVQLVVKRERRSELLPIIRRLVEADGTETVIDETKKSAKLVIAKAGVHRFEVGGASSTTGALRYSLKVKRAKPPKQATDIAGFHAAGNLTGRIILEGAVNRAGAGVGAKARTDRAVPSSDFVVGEILIGTSGAMTADELETLLEEEVVGTGFTVVQSLFDTGPHLVTIDHLSGRSANRHRRLQTTTLVQAVGRSKALPWAETNQIRRASARPSDLRYSEQYDLRQMGLEAAWDLSKGDAAVVIAVLDTGIWKHPDLDPVVVQGYDFVRDPSSAQDGNGYDPDPTDSSRNYHGTHVAGTAAAATNNGTGVAGVGWGCSIQPVRVLGFGGGTDFDIANGVLWAAGISVGGVPANPTPAKVTNMSLGGPGSSTTLSIATTAAHNAGTVLIAASGNSLSSAPFYPAAYPKVISVYALDINYTWASYSNWGNTITVGAPGGDLNAGLPGILSTFAGASGNPTYSQLQGTSMASPHVAGLAGLIRSAAPSLTPDEVRDVLVDTSLDLGPPGFDVDYGHGAVDAFAALRSVVVAPPAPPSLVATPSNLDFGRLTNSLTVYVRNTGSGEVDINRVSAVNPGAAWLTATTTATKTPATIRVDVNHELLSFGTFNGTVTIETSVGLIDVPVRVLRREPPSLEFVRVSAVNAGGAVVAATTTSEAQDWEYALTDVPLGRYRIIAEADLDLDLEVTRVDEFEGEWPILGRPDQIDVSTSDLDHAGVDVPVRRLDGRFEFDGAGGGFVNGAVAVRVFDRSTGRPIVAARAYLGDGGIAEETDANGRAVLVGTFTGAQTVTVAAEGYDTRTRIGSNAQYQSFGLVPSGVPTNTTVTVRLSGLLAGAETVVVHVGDTRATAAWNQQPTQDVVLTVPRTAPSFAVSGLVYGGDDRPQLIALGNLAAPEDINTLEIDLALAPPPGGARGRVLDMVLPSSNFTAAGADVTSLTELRNEGGRWVPIGFGVVVPSSVSAQFWASLIDLDPPLSMSITASAIDLSGRESQRIFQGHTADVAVLRPFDAPTPGTLSSPGPGSTVPTVGLSLTYAPTTDADLVDLEIRDTVSGHGWTISIDAVASGVVLPSIPTGGLEVGRDYTWRIVSRRIPNFTLSQFLEPELRALTSERTVSATRTFTTQ